MEKQFVLLKDLPDIKAGAILTGTTKEGYHLYDKYFYSEKELMENSNGWFALRELFSRDDIIVVIDEWADNPNDLTYMVERKSAANKLKQKFILGENDIIYNDSPAFINTELGKKINNELALTNIDVNEYVRTKVVGFQEKYPGCEIIVLDADRFGTEGDYILISAFCDLSKLSDANPAQ